MTEQEQAILDELEKSAKSENDDNIFAALLAIDEEKFTLIAPLMLETIESTLNDPTTQMVFINNFRKMDGSLADINNDVEEMLQAIDTQFNAISQVKRDFIKQILMYCVNSLNQANQVANQLIQVPVEICNEDAKLPAYAHLTDAGADLFALEDITINPGETVLVPTGLKMAIPQGYELQIRPKSGRCAKTKLRVANTPGTIDSGYRDEIKVILENIEPTVKDVRIYKTEDGQIANVMVIPGESYTIKKGEKFAQAILAISPKATFTQIDNVLTVSGDRGGGFGSTGL